MPDELLRCEAAPAILANIRNPLIYYVNRYFLHVLAGPKFKSLIMQA